MNIDFLKWDSDNFGFRTGRLVLDATLSCDAICELISKSDFKLVYVVSKYKLDTNAFFYDDKLLFRKKRTLFQPIKNTEIRSIKGLLLSKQIIGLSIDSGKYSRYNLDERFPTDLFKMLYTKWIENSVNSDYATDVLAFYFQDIPVGLLTYRINGNNANIGIISVNPYNRGLGVGSQLISYFESNLPEYVKTIEVITQGSNRIACGFYKKNGYLLDTENYIYHFWNDNQLLNNK